jgi:hypothetical protein
VINPLNPPVAPPLPSDAALMSALSLLSTIGNAAAAKATLDAMADHKLAIDRATEAHAAAAAEAKAATDALAGVKAQAEDVAAREKAIADSQLQLRVVSSAVQDRDRALDIRAASLDEREQQVAAKERSHADKVASMKAALG